MDKQPHGQHGQQATGKRRAAGLPSRQPPLDQSKYNIVTLPCVIRPPPALREGFRHFPSLSSASPGLCWATDHLKSNICPYRDSRRPSGSQGSQRSGPRTQICFWTPLLSLHTLKTENIEHLHQRTVKRASDSHQEHCNWAYQGSLVVLLCSTKLSTSSECSKLVFRQATICFVS